MKDNETKLTVTAERDGKRHKVTVAHDGTPLHVHTFKVSDANARAKYVAAVKSRVEKLDCEDLDAELMKLAATERFVPPQDAEGEVDRLAGTPHDILDAANAALENPELIGLGDAAAPGAWRERNCGDDLPHRRVPAAAETASRDHPGLVVIRQIVHGRKSGFRFRRKPDPRDTYDATGAVP